MSGMELDLQGRRGTRLRGEFFARPVGEVVSFTRLSIDSPREGAAGISPMA
jgi:hypothetical protein